MGIRTLASAFAFFITFDAQAATLPPVPQPRLADLGLKANAALPHAIVPGADSRAAGDKSVTDEARWLNERLPLAQEQRWVF